VSGPPGLTPPSGAASGRLFWCWGADLRCQACGARGAGRGDFTAAALPALVGNRATSGNWHKQRLTTDSGKHKKDIRRLPQMTLSGIWWTRRPQALAGWWRTNARAFRRPTAPTAAGRGCYAQVCPCADRILDSLPCDVASRRFGGCDSIRGVVIEPQARQKAVADACFWFTRLRAGATPFHVVGRAPMAVARFVPPAGTLRRSVNSVGSDLNSGS
jgi:hypothetical protein